MRLIRYLNDNATPTQGVIATIGNFDGVHLGHQAILKKMLVKSRQLQLLPIVIAFKPSAKEYFLGDQAPARLTNFREKMALICSYGIDTLVCLPFNAALANMQAEEFVEDILIRCLHVKHLTVGDNFRFGKDRMGDFDLLKNLANRFDYQVENTKSFVVDGERVSSSSIRDYLALDDLEAASRLLGRRYSMSGRVIHGERKGRTIGFPTANVPIRRKTSPITGVFAVTVRIEDGQALHGVANVGHRPTVGGTRTQLEVNIFDFSQDIYKRHMVVEFIKKIREEKKMASFAALKAQIEKDAKAAKQHFGIPV